MTKTKTAFTATFSDGKTFEIAASVKPYTHAYRVMFQQENGEWERSGGFATDLNKAEKAAKATVARVTRKFCYVQKKYVTTDTPTKVEIVPAVAG